jgi:outer membrane receptor protein involved in Fe transport
MLRYIAGFMLACLSSVSMAEIRSDVLQELSQLSLDDLLNVAITTASKHEETLSDTPAHVVVINRQQIRERRYMDLSDVLEDLPGVDFMRATKSSAFNNLSMQGHESSNKFLILQDGVRISHPSGDKIPVAENYSLHQAKQIEILYGPASALYGADAFAGVINIITESPLAQESGGNISVRGGENATHEASGNLILQFSDNAALSLSGHTQHSDRAFLPDYYADDFPRVDAVNFSGDVIVPAAEREDYAGPIESYSVSARFDFKKALTLAYDQRFFRSLTSTGDRPDTALYLEEGQWNNKLDNVYAKYRFDWTDRLSSETVLEYAKFEVAPHSKYINIFTNFQDHGYDYSKTRKRAIEQQFTWLVNDEHTLVSGLSYADLYARETPDLPKPFNPNLPVEQQNLYYNNTDLPIRLFDANYSSAALYAQLQSKWRDDLSTSLGFRYDKNSDYENSFNPRLGVVYSVNEQHTLKALYGESFRAPSSDEMFSTFGSFTGATNDQGEYLGAYFRAPNFDLNPEKSHHLGLTWDWRIRDNLSMALNAYYAQVDNLIVSRDEDIPTQYIPGAVLSDTSVKDNLGEEEHYGLDLSVNYRYALGAGWKGDLWGSYSFIDGEVREEPDSDPLDLAYIAQHKIKLGTTLRYQEHFFITPKLYWIDDTNTGREDKSNPGKRLQSDGYVLMNLHLGANWRNFSFYLDIYNLFDTRYYNAGGSGSTTFVSMPQQPRSILLGVAYGF